MRNISNSEANTWQHCRRKYYYQYYLDLEPVKQSEPITKGVALHGALEHYYLEKMDGSSEDACRNAAFDMLLTYTSIDLDELIKLKILLNRYFEAWAASDDERYEVVAVETKFAVPFGKDFNIAGTIDVIFRDLEDGFFVPVDHKSSYNFWNDDQAQVAGQFVKYVWALRERGFNVKSFMVNILRTREMKSDKPEDYFKRLMVKPSDSRIKNVINQHYQVGSEIMRFRENPIKELAYPIYDKHGCANCSFFALCDSDTEGAPLDYLIKADYQQHKDYGYNAKEEVKNV